MLLWEEIHIVRRDAETVKSELRICWFSKGKASIGKSSFKMRIGIREQLGLLVLLTTLIALAVVAVATVILLSLGFFFKSVY